ncbi:hypothetical protein TWF696_004096 [Orbilia brochopaga]|uniref:Uncharacterized protein n=1 Tax=Orbilia brochopaga TaxID=3140254 RepID=A0AAV9V6V0_9PEZI
MYFKIPAAIVVLTLAPEIAGHAVFLNFIGNASPGRKMTGFGVDERAPRTGTAQIPFQQDVTVLNNPPVPMSKWSKCYPKKKGAKPHRAAWVNHCGTTLKTVINYYSKHPNIKVGTKTLNFGKMTAAQKNYHCFQCPAPKLIDWAAESLDRSRKGQIPQCTRGGWIRAMVYQVNADGAGPYRCKISRSGVPMNWDKKWYTPVGKDQVPGTAKAKSFRGAGSRKSFPFTLRIPADMECNGVVGDQRNICMVRCENYAVNGHFGACFPFQLVKPKPVHPPKPKPGKQAPIDDEEVEKTVVVVVKEPPPPDEEDLNPGENAKPAPPPSDDDQEEQPRDPDEDEKEEDTSPAEY